MTEEKCGCIVHPKVFISYCWACQQFASELAIALRRDGVDVVFDQWALKVGDDKFYFMEQCVVDPTIDKVLILSDKTYVQKADSRNGGVGDETVLISADVYGKIQQQKFIPVVIEKNECGNVFLPAYLKSRVYVDLSSRDLSGRGYQDLLKVVYDKKTPALPPLGAPPDWLRLDSPETDKSKPTQQDKPQTKPLSKYEIEILKYAFQKPGYRFATRYTRDGKYLITPVAPKRPKPSDVLNADGNNETNMLYKAAVENLEKVYEYIKKYREPSRNCHYYELYAPNFETIRRILASESTQGTAPTENKRITSLES